MTRPWHVPLSLVACVVILAPALFVLRQAREASAAPMPEPEGLVPMLSYDARMRRATYHQTCSEQTECEAPLVCFHDGRFRSYCSDSECETDSQCPEDQRCRTVIAPRTGGGLIRLCLLVGIRQEGQNCLRTPFDVTDACTEGLECRGKEGYCARSCAPGQPGSCPEGFFCADVKPAPACLPTCEKRGCAQGERCIPFEEGTSICASIYGPNCLDTPCPAGRECRMSSNPEFPGKVWAECLHRCSPTNPACDEGQVCDHYHCTQACDPNGPNPCAEGFHCDRRGEELPWSCQPDTWRGG